MYLYQKTNRYFAQVAEGMEAIAAEELARHGAADCKTVFRGVYFSADKAVVYKVNYHCRIITRVLAALARFDCHSADYLYTKALAIEWGDFFSTHDTFAVFATVSHSAIRHSQYAALRLKDAIVDYFRGRTHARPSVKRIDPDVWINLHIENNRAVISFDTSGGSLHRRGYRQASVEAPMQETAAAAVVAMSGWDGQRPLYDPMCGSGTLLCEALMRYCGIPGNFLRKRFGFESLPDFDPAVWETVRVRAQEEMRTVPDGLISGSDISAEASAAARKNLSALPHGRKVVVRTVDMHSIESLEGYCIVCNPPYGMRLKHGGGMGDFYKRFGDFLKQRCRGSEAYIYFGDPSLIKSLGLKPSWKKPLTHGGLDGRLVKYEIY